MLKSGKSWLGALSVILFIVLVISGCGNNSNQEEGASANSTTNPSQASAENQDTSESSDHDNGDKGDEQTIRVAMATEPDNLDPYLSAATDTGSMMDNVFDGLFEAGENGDLIPAVAESYEVSEDGLTYTFNLKKGIKFHDGSDLTAEDVEYSYAKLSGLNGEEPLSSKFTTIEKIETPDENTVVVTLSEKDGAFLAANIVAIVPKDYEKQSEMPIGAGPYKFSSYTPGQELVLVKNENYYDPEGMASIERVEFKFMPDANAAVLALKSGELDMIPGISQQGVIQLGDEFQVVSGPQNMVQLMALNHSVEPLDQLLVRQAINYAIDKDVIIDTVAEGNGVKLGTNMSPAMKMYYEEGLEERYEPNAEKAKELLKEAGYENGFELTITVPSNYSFHVDTAQVIAEQLKAIGIQATIKQVEWSSWLEDVYKNAQYEATIIGLTGKLDPHEVLGRYESSYSRNFFQFSNSQFDDLINRAKLELDVNERANLYKQAQTILTDEAAAVYIMDPTRSVAMKKNLQGFKMYPIQKYDFAAMYYTE